MIDTLKYFDVGNEERPDLPLSLIGSSDVPPLLGVDPYSSVHDIFGRCAYGIEAFRPEWLEEAGAWGRDIELVTARRWARAQGYEQLAKPPTRVGPRSWQRHSVDFVAFGPKKPPAIVECKLLSERRFSHETWGPSGGNEVPFRIVAQTHSQLDAMRADAEWWRSKKVDPFEIDRVHIAVSVGAKQLASYTLGFDVELGELIAEECERLWVDFIVPKRVPPPNATEASLASLRRLYPSAVAPVRVATETEAAIAMEYVELKRALKDAETRKLALENYLAHAIGDARGIGLGGAEILWLPRVGLTRWKDVALDLAKELGLDSKAIEVRKEKHRGEPSRFFKVDLEEE